MKLGKFYRQSIAAVLALCLAAPCFSAFAANETLLEYTFAGEIAGTTPSYVTGDAVVSAEGAWLDALDKTAAFSAPAAAERVSVTAKVRADSCAVLRLYDGEAFETIRFKPASNGWEKLVVVLTNGNLSVICGTEQIAERGVSSIHNITKAEFSDMELDDVAIGQQTISPMLVNPNMYLDGDTVALDYIYFAPEDEAKPAISVDWYIAETADAVFCDYKGSGLNIAKPADSEYVFCEISFGSELITTEPCLVSDLDLLVFNDKKLGIGNAGVTFSYTDEAGQRHWSTMVSDWSAYHEVIFRTYSSVNTGRVFEPVFRSTTGYYYTYFTTDWSGNWRDVSVPIGEAAGMESSGGAVTWQNIGSVAFWTGLSTAQKEDGSLTADETDTALTVDKVFLRKKAEEDDFWNEAYILNAVKKADTPDYAEEIIAAGHPRILLTPQKLAELKEDITTDEYLKTTYNRLCSEVAANIKNAPLSVASSATAGKLAQAALLYNLNPSEELASWIWDSAVNLSKNVESWNPGSASYLTVGDTTRAMAMTYDWMYNHWTNEKRLIVRNAIMKHGFRPSISTLRSGRNWAGHGRGNWIQSILSGLGMGALAICDSVDYAELCNEVLDRAVGSLAYGIRDIEENGAYAEGVSYWHYAMDTFFPFEAALSAICGTNGGLLDKPGVDKTGYFPIMMTGPGGTFNFSDASITSSTQTAAFYRLSEYFNNPAFGDYQYTYTKEKGGDYLSLLLYDTAGYEDFAQHLPDYQYYSGSTESFVMRHDWDNNKAAYLGFKGGNNQNNHAQLDIGTFVYDYDGVRWFCDLGRDSYTYNSKWELYRNRAEGNNCLVINPDTTPDQNTSAYSRVAEHRVTERAGYGIVDMTEAYSTEGAATAKRGFAMLNGYSALLIQDEITAAEPIDVYAFMHTQATVTIADDHKSAVLTRNGKSLHVTLLSNCDAALEVMDAELLHVTASSSQWDNTGYRKLAVKASQVTNPTISVLVTKTRETPLTAIVPLEHWDSQILGLSAEVTEVTVNGTVLNAPYEAEEAIATAGAAVKITNETADEKALWLMAACYKNGVLEDVKREPYTVPGGFCDTLTIEYENRAGEDAEIRFMLWNDLLQPIMNQVVIQGRK